VVGTRSDDHTRAILALDEQHGVAYVLATQPEDGGAIRVKSASLDGLEFAPGPGELFIYSSLDQDISNATSSKHNVNGTTGLVVQASDKVTRWYLHNYAVLGDGGGDATVTPTVQAATPTATPDGNVVTLVLSASDDTLIKSASPDNSYGSWSHLRCRLSSSEEIRSYVKFDVTGVVGAIYSATLRLFAYDGSDDGGRVYWVSNYFRDSDVPWTQGALTWNNAPAIEGTPLASAGQVTSGMWVEFDVSPAVLGNGPVSFGLLSLSSNSVYFRSTEATADPPELVIVTDGPT
jgi:hypothetical protein